MQKLGADSVKNGETIFKVDFSDVKFSQTIEDVTFDSCVLNDADFSRLYLGGVRFIHCKMERTKFYRSRIMSCYFIHCRFRDVNFISADLEMVDIENCHFEGADIFDAEMNNVTFSGMNRMFFVNAKE